MSNWLISYALSQLELIIRLLLASICGYVIGHERNNRKKEAGIRTHIIVAIASCLMMEISKYGFADSGDFDGCDTDSRICCNYVISSKQRKKGRITVVIVNEDLGY